MSGMSRRIIVDQTNLRGHVTGIERVALELFGPQALAPHRVELVRSRGLLSMMLKQHLGLPARGLADRRALFVFPGFPPGPLAVALGDRCLIYVHDTFLLTRPEDLSWKARLYMAPSFRFAVRRGRRFLVNSETTATELRAFTRAGAAIDLLRPKAGDVFGLVDLPPPSVPLPGETLRLLAIGTIEPRKNYPAAIAIVEALNARGIPARLDIVGRIGWGEHAFLRDPPPHIGLHHGVDDAGMRRIVESSHLLLSTSKAEGLGLPLLEVQHGGLPVVAPRGAVFEEVLAGSGLHVDPLAAADAAEAIARFAFEPGRLAEASRASRANVARWTGLADQDAARFRASLEEPE
ncbi:glycosyltransferase [Enterovirga rhinocerotis]|uniref:Glycosyltransferase involved in cell wall biosynthesis n=1 Tax=Enterovirga rhinocerotis TaxID=1339210 RepID=A0A4R7C8R0_9HYPH|nr:glycosyltransferase [Enterovirga rhinocerotis]TDR95044.1 glycosyltransferase involved in cell wall biosynthesis [Enterovirga rhinocerotis]